jgi:uncharacterized glyoxalase superfamily protein PhnB
MGGRRIAGGFSFDDMIAICVKYCRQPQRRALVMITPVLFYRDPMAAIRFLQDAFGFEVAMLLTDDQGRLGHSELRYDGASISVGGEWESQALLGPARMRSPSSLEGAGSQFLRIGVAEPIDAHCERARAAGARITQTPEDQFYGERTYRALDPEGHVWNFAQKVRDVSVAEMESTSGLKASTRVPVEGAPQ